MVNGVKRGGIPKDISPLVLEYHARMLGMSVDDLLKRLSELPGKTTAEKIQRLYEERRAQRTAEMVYVPVLYIAGSKETAIPGNYRIRALILPPDSDSPAWSSIFVDSSLNAKITSAPLGTVLEVPGNRFEYDEQFGSYTIRTVRSVLPPNKDLLDTVAKEPSKDFFDSLTGNEIVVLKIRPSEFDVDTGYTETSQGTKVLRLLGKLGDTDLLTVTIYDVDNIPGDPWTDIKGYPVVYVSGKFRGVVNGIYRFNASKVFVPEGTEQTLEEQIIDYMNRKGKKELSPRALARALRVSEAEIISTARSSDRLDYDEDADVIVLK